MDLYTQITNLLEDLTPPELANLNMEIARRLQRAVGAAEPLDEEIAADGTRRYLPRMPHIIEWGLVKPMEDRVYISGEPEEVALLVDAYHVVHNAQRIDINAWARDITGWKSVNIYESIVVERTGETLDAMRRAYIDEHGWSGE
ncbi:MAG: hypothetical protein GYB64_16290 [Chloroflexi bacterium]|nr:hypothetical protein [Chloroflexota bacterium]